MKSKWYVKEWHLGEGRGNKTVQFDSFLDFSEDWRGKGGPGEAGFRAEWLPRGIVMGPIIVQCPDSSYEIDYVKE